jgi:hypothetical protein
MRFKNGDVFEGEWKNNKKEGKGLYRWKNGDKYEGFFIFFFKIILAFLFLFLST